MLGDSREFWLQLRSFARAADLIRSVEAVLVFTADPFRRCNEEMDYTQSCLQHVSGLFSAPQTDSEYKSWRHHFAKLSPEDLGAAAASPAVIAAI